MLEERRGEFFCATCGARERDCPGDCKTGHRPADGSRGDPNRHGFGVIDTPTPRAADPLPMRERWAREWSPSGNRNRDQVWVRASPSYYAPREHVRSL